MHRYVLLVFVFVACGDRQPADRQAAKASGEAPGSAAAAAAPAAPAGAPAPGSAAGSGDPWQGSAAARAETTCCCEVVPESGIGYDILDRESCQVCVDSWGPCQLDSEPVALTLAKPVEAKWVNGGLPITRWPVNGKWIALQVAAPDAGANTGSVRALVDGTWREVHRFRYDAALLGTVSAALRRDGTVLFTSVIEGEGWSVDAALLRYDPRGKVKVTKKWSGDLDDLPAWAK